MAKSGIQHVVSAVPIAQTTFVDEEFHALIHGSSFPASPVERQLFYRDDEHIWYIYNGTAWTELTVIAIDELNDIGDVNVPTPANQQGIGYDTGTSKWILTSYMLSKLLTARGDIITRSATVPKRLALGTAGYYLRAGASEPAWAALAVGDMPTAIKTLTITFIIDGGGSAITTGEKGHLEIPFACTITGWTILADQSGSIVVDVWKDTYALFPPTVADTIAGTEKPTLVTAQKNQDLDLTTWTIAIAAGDILAFYVESVATVERVTISLKVVKT